MKLLNISTAFIFLTIISEIILNCEAVNELEFAAVIEDVTKMVNKAQTFINRYSDFSGVPMVIRNRTETFLFGAIDGTMVKLQQLTNQMNKASTHIMLKILQITTEQSPLAIRINNLLDYLTEIDAIQAKFTHYVKHRKDFVRLTLKNFAKFLVSPDSTSINNLLNKIHQILVPTRRGQIGMIQLLNDLSNNMKTKLLCESKQSFQQLLYQIYNTKTLVELQGYVMLRYAYMLLKVYLEGNFVGELNLTKIVFKARHNEIETLFGSVIENASRELWRCDPENHKKDETYTEITQLMQGYIGNQADLNEAESCSGSCSQYVLTQSYGCKHGGYCRSHRKCKGKIMKCQFFREKMDICMPNSTASIRRYEFIELDNHRSLGHRNQCKRKAKVESQSWWVFWKCDYCFCVCDEITTTSDKYFNLRPSIADMKNNKVVTGLRFIKNNRIIHLQIQEGKLLPRGNIDPATVRWVPVENYKITDKKMYQRQDYHVLTWNERAIDLDDLQAEDGFLVTGVRFKRIGAHLNFEILTTKFNFETGQLIDAGGTSHWVDNVHRTEEVHLNRPDIPTRSGFPSAPISKPNQYIQFTHSDINKDAAQTTVPFIDTQSVESSLPMPLNGAGIFYKGRYGFGGFIAPKIFTYDISKHYEIRDNN